MISLFITSIIGLCICVFGAAVYLYIAIKEKNTEAIVFFATCVISIVVTLVFYYKIIIIIPF